MIIEDNNSSSSPSSSSPSSSSSSLSTSLSASPSTSSPFSRLLNGSAVGNNNTNNNNNNIKRSCSGAGHCHLQSMGSALNRRQSFSHVKAGHHAIDHQHHHVHHYQQQQQQQHPPQSDNICEQCCPLSTRHSGGVHNATWPRTQPQPSAAQQQPAAAQPAPMNLAPNEPVRCSGECHHHLDHQASTTTINNTNNSSTTSNEHCAINASLTIRRVLQLYEMGECREAATVISRLPYGLFRMVVLDLPVDLFVEAMPVSLPILDALYAKVFFSGRDLLAFGFKFLHPENVVLHMIRMFAMGNLYPSAGNEESIGICKKLLKVILITDSSLRKQLLVKKALLDRAVEGMGHHGLVGTSNDALMNLHEALKLEFERVIQQYKSAIAKIDELSLTRGVIKDGGPITRSLSQGPAPTFSSHQRLLSLKQEEIQDRLNKNRSLLCALEPCFRTNHSLQILLAILQKRIDYDKETLFQFGQLRKEYVLLNSVDSSTGSGNTSASSSTSLRYKSSSLGSSSSLHASQFERDTVVAPVLMRYSHGCAQVLSLLKEIQQETGAEDEDDVLLTAHCPNNGTGAGTPSVSMSSTAITPATNTANNNNSASGLNVPATTNNNNHHHHGGVASVHKSAASKASNNNNNNNNNMDDSSDISGYHSDSDGSPVNNTARLAACSASSGTVINPASNADDNMSTGSNVAILTGRADGTTLLVDGEVTVSGGLVTNVQRRSTRRSANGVHFSALDEDDDDEGKDGDIDSGDMSVCRIRVNETIDQVTPSAGGDNNNTNELYFLRRQLAKAHSKIEQLESRQRELQVKVATQSSHMTAVGMTRYEGQLNLDETKRVNQLIRRYQQLFTQVRVDVLDALDQFKELDNSAELKSKLLLSIIVLSYRSTGHTLEKVSGALKSLLRLERPYGLAADEDEDVKLARRDVENCVSHYLRLTSDAFDVAPNVEEVCNQLWKTLFDYPCLRNCPSLVDFVRHCTRLTWSLLVQRSRFTLDIETKVFREEWHSRLHEADNNSDTIRSYQWPTLFEEGICVVKGMVIT